MSKKDETNQDYEITPDILFARIMILEDELLKNKLNKDTMNELLDLYTVASEFYQENGMTKAFNSNIQKMKNFFQHEKIQSLIKKDRTSNFNINFKTPPVNTISIRDIKTDNYDDYDKPGCKTDRIVPTLDLNTLRDRNQKKENLKKKMDDSKKDVIGEVRDMISSFTAREITPEIKSNEINSQTVSFRARLDKKKIMKTTKSSKSLVGIKFKENYDKENKDGDRDRDVRASSTDDLKFVYSKDKNHNSRYLSFHTEIDHNNKKIEKFVNPIEDYEEFDLNDPDSFDNNRKNRNLTTYKKHNPNNNNKKGILTNKIQPKNIFHNNSKYVKSYNNIDLKDTEYADLTHAKVIKPTNNIVYDKKRNSFNLTKTKFFEIHRNLMTHAVAKTKEIDNNFIEEFFHSQAMADIFEKELNNFFNKVFKSKINWITKIQEDIEKLIDTYPKLYEEKLRSINDRYEDELKELEVDLNHDKKGDLSYKIYTDIMNDKNDEINELNKLKKEMIEEVFSQSQSEEDFLNEKKFKLALDEHKHNILLKLKTLFINTCDLQIEYKPLETVEEVR